MIRTVLHTSFTAAIALVAARAQATTAQQPLPAAEGWDAALIHRATGGVWYAFVDQAIEAFGAPEAIFADDDGRVTVLSVYSGKWTERSVNPDGQWLAFVTWNDEAGGGLHRIRATGAPCQGDTVGQQMVEGDTEHQPGNQTHHQLGAGVGHFDPGGQQAAHQRESSDDQTIDNE